MDFKLNLHFQISMNLLKKSMKLSYQINLLSKSTGVLQEVHSHFFNVKFDFSKLEMC